MVRVRYSMLSKNDYGPLFKEVEVKMQSVCFQLRDFFCDRSANLELVVAIVIS